MKPFSQRTNAEIYLEWLNDWLTLGKMADNYGRTTEEMSKIIELGRIEHEENVISLNIKKDL